IDRIDLNAEAAVDVVTAISLIESALASEVACGGLIHIPFSLMAFLKKNNLIEIQGNEVYSPSGYRIIAGSGYDGSGSDGPADAGETRIYATGPMLIARSNVMMVPENVAEGVNRNINNLTVRAERFYSVGFSCSLLA